ncbi:hypothetical protein BYT27DRAFT_7140732 [Phlegmacium glaucopus]|nr:hypothetical protein BYT27DRAFT_7140732 [Phlegmacium glaucopus]
MPKSMLPNPHTFFLAVHYMVLPFFIISHIPVFCDTKKATPPGDVGRIWITPTYAMVACQASANPTLNCFQEQPRTLCSGRSLVPIPTFPFSLGAWDGRDFLGLLVEIITGHFDNR